MALDRLAGEEEGIGNFGIARAANQHLGDLLLAFRHAGRRTLPSLTAAAPGPHSERSKSMVGQLDKRPSAHAVGHLAGFAIHIRSAPVLAGASERSGEVEPGH